MLPVGKIRVNADLELNLASQLRAHICHQFVTLAG